MGKFARMTLIFIPLFLLGLTMTVYAQTKTLQISGVDDDSSLGEWLGEVIIKRYDEAEERQDEKSLKNDTLKAMEAKGYYKAKVNISRKPDSVPFLYIEKGPQFKISSITVQGVDGYGVRTLEAGEPLDALSVLEAQRNLGEDIQAEGCFYDLEITHQVVLNHKENTGAVTYLVTAGPKAKFGNVTFEGATNIERKHLRRFLQFEQGECWQQSKIEDTKNALLETGLLSLVREELPEAPDADQTVDITFELVERAPRSVRIGISYYTDEGPGLVAEWQHRNLKGEGDSFELKLRTNFLEQGLSADYAKPYFMDDEDLALNLFARLAREDTDAYEETGLNLSASVDKRFDKYLKGTFGSTLELTRIRDKSDNDESDFGLVSVFGQMTFDNRDNPLNSTRGFLIRARTEPFFDVFGEADPFIKSSIGVNTYLSLTEDRDLVLALRGRLGTIAGAAVENIPANKRFYAGGAGSIRGFGYQEASPFEGGDPSGGRSLIETGTELRYRFKENMGVVAFVDAGGAYESEYPDFNEGLYIGAGVGFRYYTGFGPLRFDVAVPVNKNDQASSPFQIYASIGQAF